MKKIFFILFLVFSFIFGFKTYSSYSEYEICSEKSKTAKPLFGEEIIFKYYGDRIINLKKFFYQDSGYVCFYGQVLKKKINQNFFI